MYFYKEVENTDIDQMGTVSSECMIAIPTSDTEKEERYYNM